jgi:hypothetical protein
MHWWSKSLNRRQPIRPPTALHSDFQYKVQAQLLSVADLDIGFSFSLKGSSSALTLYCPGGRFGRLNAPASLVNAVELTPVLTLVAVTVTPGRSAFVVSSIVPPIAPFVRLTLKLRDQ